MTPAKTVPPDVSPTASPNIHWFGWGLAILSSMAFSLATPLGKLAINDGLSPMTLVMWRFGLATVLLALTLAWQEPQKLKLEGRRGRIALAAGLINGLGVICFWQALAIVDASIATVLFALAPLFVLGALALRGERFTWRQIVRLALGLTGVYLLVGPGGQVDSTGLILVLLAIIAFTIEITTVQWFLNDQDTRTVTLYVLAGMWLTITAGWLISGADGSVPGWKGWLAIIVLGIISTYIGWWIMFRAIQLIGSGQYALLLPVETLLAIFWSYLWLTERLRPLQWAGCLLILISAVLAVQRLGRVKNRRRWRVWLRPTR